MKPKPALNFEDAASGRHFFETFDGHLICVNGQNNGPRLYFIQ